MEFSGFSNKQDKEASQDANYPQSLSNWFWEVAVVKCWTVTFIQGLENTGKEIVIALVIRSHEKKKIEVYSDSWYLY